MASRTARSVDRTVDKMLRQMAQTARPSAGSAGSASSAAQALERMAEIQKRIARGDMEAAQFLTDQAIKQAEAEESPEVRREKLRALQAEKEKAVWWKSPALLGSAIVAGVLVLGLALVATRSGGHAVNGRVFVDERAARDVDLVFHSLSRSDVRVKIRTSEDGSFAVDSLPPGDYKVLVMPSDGSQQIPRKYASPISTPFRLKLHEDTSDYTMSVASEQKTRQG